MSSAIVSSKGEILLPLDALQRHGSGNSSRVRVVETRTGILLVPMTGEPMSPELAEELAQWQTLAASSWDRFPYGSEGK